MPKRAMAPLILVQHPKTKLTTMVAKLLHEAPNQRPIAAVQK
jgi:hypothetical protein